MSFVKSVQGRPFLSHGPKLIKCRRVRWDRVVCGVWCVAVWPSGAAWRTVLTFCSLNCTTLSRVNKMNYPAIQRSPVREPQASSVCLLVTATCRKRRASHWEQKPNSSEKNMSQCHFAYHKSHIE